MRVLSWEELLAGRLPAQPTVASIGVFDGVHRGHQALFQTMRQQYPEYRSLVVSFRRSPKEILRPSQFKGDICSLPQKLGHLVDNGLDLCVLIDFSENFSKMEGEHFVQSLVQSGGVRSFIVGWNFFFGRGLSARADNLAALAGRFDANAEVLPPYLLDGHPVSSTRIREAVNEGRMRQALAMLGYPYTLDLSKYSIDSDGPRLRARPSTQAVLGLKPGTYAVGVRYPESAGQAEHPARLTVTDGNELSWTANSLDKADSIVFYQDADEHTQEE